MDLLRRSAAGELAALFGRPALEMDREARLLRLRLVARRAVTALRADERGTPRRLHRGGERGPRRARGAALRVPGAARGARPVAGRGLAPVRPRHVPRPPGPAAVAGVRARPDARDAPAGAGRLPGPRRAPSGTRRSRASRSRCPRCRGRTWSTCGRRGPRRPRRRPAPPDPAPSRSSARRSASGRRPDDDFVRGSNNWAVAGAHTAHGGALLANDMHLGISVPNTWYRLSLVVPGRGRREARHRRDASRRALRGRGQQRPRGLGLHEQRGRLGRPRPPRARPAEPRRLPHARGPAAARARDRDDRGEGRRRRRRSPSSPRSGAR